MEESKHPFHKKSFLFFFILFIPSFQVFGVTDSGSFELQAGDRQPEYSGLITAEKPSEFDSFGWSVAVSGDRMLVGRSDGDVLTDGAAFAFEFDGQQWVPTQKLIGADAVRNDEFGEYVAIHGNKALVSAIGGDDGKGAVYAFNHNGTEWIETQKITNPIGNFLDFFGGSLAVKGNLALIGATAHDFPNGNASGAVFAFRYDVKTSSWQQFQKISASDGDRHEAFGSSVAISGERAVIGARLAEGKGAAYVFEYDGKSWIETKKLLGSDTVFREYFGTSVDIDNESILVGAPYEDGTFNAAGSAYLYEFDGLDWTETKKFMIDEAELDLFGSAVSLFNNRVAIGSWRHDGLGSDSGIVYYFEDVVDKGWMLSDTFTMNNENDLDAFGRSLDMSSKWLIVGAPGDENGQGSVSTYIFDSIFLSDFE